MIVAMEIIEEPETERECPFCGAEFCYDQADIASCTPPTVNCPFCKGTVQLLEPVRVRTNAFGDTQLGENLGCAAMILAAYALVFALSRCH